MTMAYPQLFAPCTVPSDGIRRAIHFDPEVVLMACAHLSNGKTALGAVVESHQHAGEILALDLHGRAIYLVGFEKGLNVVQRLLANRNDRGQICEDRLDLQSSDVFREIAPMRPDVGEGTAESALTAVEPPGIISLFQEPVLEIGSMDEMNPPYCLLRDTTPRLLYQRIAAISEGHRMDNARRVGGLQKFAGLRRGHRQGLIANDVLVLSQRGEDGRAVQMIWSCDVDYIDRGVRCQVFEACVYLWNPISGRFLVRQIWM